MGLIAEIDIILNTCFVQNGLKQQFSNYPFYYISMTCIRASMIEFHNLPIKRLK